MCKFDFYILKMGLTNWVCVNEVHSKGVEIVSGSEYSFC